MKRSMQTKPSIVFAHGLWADLDVGEDFREALGNHLAKAGLGAERPFH